MPLSEEGLKAIATHRYVACEPSLLDGLFQPWWNAATAALPRWLAPNAVTLLGTVAVVSTLPLTIGAEPLSAAANVALAVAVFVYQTADAIDGKQARRLGLSSPLGQLVDHGCDALVTPAIVWNLARSLGVPYGIAASYTLHATVVFFVVHADAFASHELRTHVGGCGVTEVQCAAVVLHLAASLGLLRDAAVRQLLQLGFSVTVVAAIAVFQLRLLLGNNTPSFRSNALHTVLAVVWYTLPNADTDPLLLCAAVLHTVHAATQVIVGSMAREEAEFDLSPWQLGILVVARLVATPSARASALAFVATRYLAYCVTAATQIAAHLRIPVLTVPLREGHAECRCH
jgi:phosphatidylglycerophosphate synthase